MASQEQVVAPGVPASAVSLIDTFYRVSDLPTDDEYMACFAPDAVFNIMKERVGHDEILQSRKWGKTTRTGQVHRWSHIWTTGPDVYYVLGDIDFDRTADGAQVRRNPWIGRFVTTGGEKPLIKDYYVWVRFPSMQGDVADPYVIDNRTRV
ncbi:hypothetical protein CC85DRAFT_144641 [Cutaneotrichosporon oleaginosum]|uniref:SnoaL-like domain-containing protein n=1 Tax=Cutaneotrichosporon oleaginosum TaxID=879819 RepID=A0A0J0XHS6_9TREE|nr:uncharacterized protein CC85DRAFT_144641 [Cutaneotrichosporon oleaginosum]KLT40628.1 hypothetical protein CC85DRAFT_144641 [Cutaneotrichosporon oleaginosum]TXT12438.1 hypothetical protein COLE_02848 [Cutaneotrichosporon oleaginosum]